MVFCVIISSGKFCQQGVAIDPEEVRGSQESKGERSWEWAVGSSSSSKDTTLVLQNIALSLGLWETHSQKVKCLRYQGDLQNTEASVCLPFTRQKL